MQTIFLVVLITVTLAIAAMALWRWSDYRADRRARARLIATQPAHPPLFDRPMLAGLPEPARRYFGFCIAPGTPLYTVANISMSGRFIMGTASAPLEMTMFARQTLATPTGSVWAMRANRGVLHLSGSDSHNWTRFWLMELLPVARFGGTPDHARSAFGRFCAEALFWTPAALLPGADICWQAVNRNTARVHITQGDLSQSVDLEVDDAGQPVTVSFLRWSNANSEKQYRLQPFGGTLSAFRTFDGFTLPTRIEAGNHFGTEDYFPFFLADVSKIEFPHS